MERQTEDLDVSEDDFVGFIWLFSDHPSRPAMPTAEEHNEIQKRHIEEFPYFPLMRLHKDWMDFADK